MDEKPKWFDEWLVKEFHKATEDLVKKLEHDLETYKEEYKKSQEIIVELKEIITAFKESRN